MITECGIFGCISDTKNDEVIVNTINGLDLLQHRGRESAGIAFYKTPNLHSTAKVDNKIMTHKALGLVKDVFTLLLFNPSFPKKNKCIGHVRYSTSGKIENTADYCGDHIQPMVDYTCDEDFAIVYNGNIKNLDRVREKYGLNMERDTREVIDTKMIISIIKNIKKSTMKEKLIEFMKNVNGVFCLLIMNSEGLYCMRDSFGVRPLCFGALFESGDDVNAKKIISYCISSESCALQNYQFIREVEPGEILFFGRKKIGDSSFHMKKVFQLKRKPQNIQKCIFEYIYFMNKNTRTNDKTISQIRYEVGQKIASEDIALFFSNNFDLSNSLVCGCPQTGIEYGRGYAEKSGISYTQFLNKTQNCGRTFILPENSSRIISCKKNLFISSAVKNRDLILLDDSLVRGNTITTVIQKLREHGAKSVHIRITSPPVKFPCFFGVDIPTSEELIASSNSVEEIRKKIGADSLSYTSLDIIKDAIACYGGGGGGEGFCSACFDGNYKQDLLDW